MFYNLDFRVHWHDLCVQSPDNNISQVFGWHIIRIIRLSIWSKDILTYTDHTDRQLPFRASTVSRASCHCSCTTFFPHVISLTYGLNMRIFNYVHIVTTSRYNVRWFLSPLTLPQELLWPFPAADISFGGPAAYDGHHCLWTRLISSSCASKLS